MNRRIKYKRPRKINPVSVTIVGIIAFIIYVIAKTGPIFLTQMETQRVIKGVGVKFQKSRSRYLSSPESLEMLRNNFMSDIFNVGVEGRDTTEHWIDISDTDAVMIGVHYQQRFEWPFEMRETTIIEVDQEILCPGQTSKLCIEQEF